MKMASLAKPHAISLESAFRHPGEYMALEVTGVDLPAFGQNGRRTAYVYLQDREGNDWYLSAMEDEGRRIRSLMEIAEAGRKVLMAGCTNTRQGLDVRFTAIGAQERTT